jgi:hypothetical protein
MVLKEAGRFHCRQHRLRFGGQRQTLFVTFKRGKRGNVLPGGHGWPHKAFGGVAPLVRGGPSCRRRKGGGRIYFEFVGWNPAEEGGMWGRRSTVYRFRRDARSGAWRSGGWLPSKSQARNLLCALNNFVNTEILPFSVFVWGLAFSCPRASPGH